MANNSPWISQLDPTRERVRLNEDLTTQVAIVGAGIAGVATAYFTLKRTDLDVVLLEGYKLAHGATGHNAGQLTTYFERSFKSIAEEFGLELAMQAERDLASTWDLLQEMYQDAELKIFLSRFEGFTGLSSKEQVLETLENDLLRRKAGLNTPLIEISEEVDFLPEIPKEYQKLIKLVSPQEIALKLQTLDPQYVALFPTTDGLMNGALFCQEMVEFLKKRYPKRFRFYEHTSIKKVVIHEDKVLLDAMYHTVEAQRVVLCTNGFENFDIITREGLVVNTRFHHELNGMVGFMTGYFEKSEPEPSAVSFFPQEGPNQEAGDNYFYVTRRPYKENEAKDESLVCIGGPEFMLEERTNYDRNLTFSDEAKSKIKNFVKKTYDRKDDLEYRFMWHGVMGYTTNRLRMIGVDSAHPNLFYNLGCNGVGLLPSIWGGLCVARDLAGEKRESSIFDVPKRLSGRAL